MQYLADLGDKISEITAYDVKSAFDKAKAYAMNYTPMQAKVHEATNGDAWGASSTLMQEIASATRNYQDFNEIMPIIYDRFVSKEAREWRQIYKSLQLLEYLVKHGSERVIDDARSHLSMIKMLRNFHYIDDKGKDQGINVRNRSKELVELLSDLDKVRQERRKAKANKSKYVGSEGGALSFQTSSGSKYGGFGSDQYYGRSSPSMSGEGGESSYPSSSNFGSNTTRRDSFEEYDAGEDDDRASSAKRSSSQRSSARSVSVSAAPAPIKKDTPAKAAKELNLFDFDDEDAATSAPSASSLASQLASTSLSGKQPAIDDDFDDFQSAVPAPAAAPAQTTAAPLRPQAPAASANFFDMMGSTSSAPLSPVGASQPQMRTSQNMPAGPNYSGVGLFASPTQQIQRPSMGIHSFSSSAAVPQSSSQQPIKPTNSKSAGAFDFDDLFAASGAKSNGAASKAGVSAAGKNSLANLAVQQGSNQLWSAAPANGAVKQNHDDLLF